MADKITSKARSLNMSHIRSKDTGPEVYLRKQLFSKGFRYFKNSSKYPGHPDMFITKYNTAVFINGCFWHRHNGCKLAYLPKSREEFWNKKFLFNVERDRRVKEILNDKGIKCLIVWECTIREMKKSLDIKEEKLVKITAFLNSSDMYAEI